MSVSLQKGQKVSLSKENAGLSQVIAGLGWDEVKRARKGLFAPKPQPIDCDASALLLRNGKLVDKADIIYFGNLRHKSGTVQHMGDNLTGEGEGDDEQIEIDLTKIPANVSRIAFTVTIYDADVRRQNFGQVSNAFIRIVDDATGKELIHFDLGEDFSIETAVVVGELYKHNGEWKFNAIGNGVARDLAGLCQLYGVETN